MKKFIVLSLSATLVTLLSACCNNGECQSDVITSEEVITTVYCENDSCYIVDGIIYESQPTEMITIISMDNDTLSFGSESAVIEGGAVIIGDTAMIYYIFDEEAMGSGSCSPKSKEKGKSKSKKRGCNSEEKMPKAKKIVVKPTQK